MINQIYKNFMRPINLRPMSLRPTTGRPARVRPLARRPARVRPARVRPAKVRPAPGRPPKNEAKNEVRPDAIIIKVPTSFITMPSSAKVLKLMLIVPSQCSILLNYQLLVRNNLKFFTVKVKKPW